MKPIRLWGDEVKPKTFKATKYRYYVMNRLNGLIYGICSNKELKLPHILYINKMPVIYLRSCYSNPDTLFHIFKIY